MTDKELRKLSRADLLEILLKQSKKIEALNNELEQTKAKLEEKEIILSESGSIAEAALELNGVFEAAQKAVEQYVYNVKMRYK